MVEISLSGSGEGPGWVTAPGYSTAALLRDAQELTFGRKPTRAHSPDPEGHISRPPSTHL